MTPPAIMTRGGSNSLARREVKTVTFDGNANTGAIGAVPLFTVTGSVLIHLISARATTDLGGATATISLGTAAQVAAFIAATTATDIDTTELWTSATPTVGAVDTPDSMSNMQVSQDIRGTVAVAAITSGVLEVTVLWEPLSPGATLVAA